MTEMIGNAMRRHQWTAADVGLIVPHQSNTRMFKAVAERLNLPAELLFSNLAAYGNTSAASVPLALDEACRAGKIPAGKPVLLLGFGGGLTWGSAVVDW